MTQPLPERPSPFAEAVPATIIIVLGGAFWMAVGSGFWGHFVITAAIVGCYWTYLGLMWLRERRRQ